MIRYYYVRESTDPEEGFNCRALHAEKIKKCGENERPGKPGEGTFVSCCYMGMESCENCLGYDHETHEVHEYDETFKKMLKTLVNSMHYMSKRELSDIVGEDTAAKLQTRPQ